MLCSIILCIIVSSAISCLALNRYTGNLNQNNVCCLCKMIHNQRSLDRKDWGGWWSDNHVCTPCSWASCCRWRRRTNPSSRSCWRPAAALAACYGSAALVFTPPTDSLNRWDPFVLVQTRFQSQLLTRPSYITNRKRFGNFRISSVAQRTPYPKMETTNPMMQQRQSRVKTHRANGRSWSRQVEVKLKETELMWSNRTMASPVCAPCVWASCRNSAMPLRPWRCACVSVCVLL